MFESCTFCCTLGDGSILQEGLLLGLSLGCRRRNHQHRGQPQYLQVETVLSENLGRANVCLPLLGETSPGRLGTDISVCY